MTLAELVADLERRAADAERLAATAPVAVVLRQVATELAPLANGHGKPPAPSIGAPERLFTPGEVAQRLRVSRRFVYAHRDQLGGRALSRRALRFPESAITRYLERRR